MLIHKIIPSVDYDYWLKLLDTQLNKYIHQNSFKVPKVVMLTNKKSLALKTLGTSVKKQPIVPSPSLN